MNNKAIATESRLRRLSGGQPPFHFFSRCRAKWFAVLALAPLFAVLFSSSALAQVKVAGQLLIDLSDTRGTNTAVGMSSVAGETNLLYWTNYGTLGGTFNSILNSVYATGYTGGTNPPAMTLLTSGSVSALAPEAPAGTRIMIASFATPSQLQTTNHWTVECWFYNLTTANPRGVFAWTLAAPTANDAGEFSAAATASWHNDANNLNWNSAGTAPSTSVWHHGVITYDGAKECVYLDGVLTDSAVHSLNIDVETINPALFSQLGANPPTATSSSFNGAIAALRVHTEALAASDVTSNYAAGIAAVPAAPTNSISIDSSPATAILGASATLNGVLNATTSPGTTALTFFYDTVDHGDATNAWPHSVTATTPVSIPGTFSANITGLTISTTYYVRIYAADANSTNMSSFVTSFTTEGKPVVANSGASFDGPGFDYLIGHLINDGTTGGGAYVTIYWGPSDGGTNSASWLNSIPLGTVNNGYFNAQVSGLTTLGTYYFTVCATNVYGTNWGTPSMAFQEGVIFSLIDTNLPAASLPPAPLTPVTSWQSSAGAFARFSGAPNVHDFGGVQYLSLTGANSDSMTLPLAAFPGGTPNALTINGATLVAVLEPTLATFGYPGNVGGITIASVYDTQFGLGAGGALTATIIGGSVTGVTITAGGSGYTSPPTVTFSPPGGMSANTTATGTAQISSAGHVTNVVI
ncbi:MAG: LamG-like jellyroll fold domain-containing protein, partial [Verrucomicrobiota bacterium]